MVQLVMTIVQDKSSLDSFGAVKQSGRGCTVTEDSLLVSLRNPAPGSTADNRSSLDAGIAKHNIAKMEARRRKKFIDSVMDGSFPLSQDFTEDYNLHEIISEDAFGFFIRAKSSKGLDVHSS